MSITARRLRYRAASMALAADLDERLIEMRIRTRTGEHVSIVCNGRAIFAIKRHIEEMVEDCPEMNRW